MKSFKRRNTLFNKTIFIFTLVSFISFILTGILMSRFMITYSVEQSAEQMAQTATMINKMIDIFIMESVDDTIYKDGIDQIQKLASIYNDLIDGHIYIVEMSPGKNMGRVVISVPEINKNNNINKVNLINNGDDYFFSEEQYSTVWESDKPIVDAGDYYGLYKDTNTNWVSYARKLETNMEDGSVIRSGIIVISSPMAYVNLTRNRITSYFLFSMCIALMLSIFLSAFFTKRITGPLETLKIAANRVSKGDFCGKIEYDTNDDMGELINSFNAMTISLENLDKTKNDFIANVSHELRTPITTIGGFIDGMLDGTIPEEKRDYYLKIVKDEVKRMNNLVNDQLQMARLQQGIANLKKTSFDINEMIRQEIIKNEKNIEDKNIEIMVEFEEEKQNVFAEEESINRVIINLLNNAIKFTPENGMITLGTLKRKGLVEVYIKDTGVGIAPNELERIFERYFKSDRSRGIDKTGTGLGLSICKSIINAHNQEIKARNNTDSPGTKFTFWLDAI